MNEKTVWVLVRMKVDVDYPSEDEQAVLAVFESKEEATNEAITYNEEDQDEKEDEKKEENNKKRSRDSEEEEDETNSIHEENGNPPTKKPRVESSVESSETWSETDTIKMIDTVEMDHTIDNKEKEEKEKPLDLTTSDSCQEATDRLNAQITAFFENGSSGILYCLEEVTYYPASKKSKK